MRRSLRSWPVIAEPVDVSYSAYDEHPLDRQTNGEICLLPSRRDSLVTNLPARGEMWWCEMPEIVAARSWCCPGRGHPAASPGTHRALRRPSGALRVRFFWNPARTDSTSIGDQSTRWRASQSRSLSSVWDGCRCQNAGRSAPPSPSQSTAQKRSQPRADRSPALSGCRSASRRRPADVALADMKLKVRSRDQTGLELSHRPARLMAANHTRGLAQHHLPMTAGLPTKKYCTRGPTMSRTCVQNTGMEASVIDAFRRSAPR